MKLKLAAYLLFTLSGLCAMSAFAYAGFAFEWWRPIGDREFLRPMLLTMMHIVVGIGGTAIGCLLMDESNK